MRKKKLELSMAQEQELRELARHSPVPHIRMKALAVYDVGRGIPRYQVARLLNVERRSVGRWMAGYVKEGVAAFAIKAGRGRRPQVSREEVEYYLRQSPNSFGLGRSRWTLALLGQVVPSLRGMSQVGIWQALGRLGYRYKRAQPSVHSPDPQYGEKKGALEQALKEVEGAQRKVLLFQDEATFYRQPSQGWLWSWIGRKQPKMRYSHRSNTRMRVVAFMEAVTGRVLAWDMAQVTVDRLAQCIRRISGAFPQMETIYIVWDNWPVHTHPTVQAALEKDPRIHVLSLPTYAPWLNNIEKLWRLVRQEVAHAHPWCDDFHTFRAAIIQKLSEFTRGSTRLLQYCGLS